MSQGLKPTLMDVRNAQAKAWAYLRAATKTTTPIH